MGLFTKLASKSQPTSTTSLMNPETLVSGRQVVVSAVTFRTISSIYPKHQPPRKSGEEANRQEFTS